MKKPCARPLVKVCGITREADARLCAGLGADLLGFIFHDKSPRYVSPALPAGLDLPGVRTVGLFVRQSLDETLRIMEAGRLDLAQLHGGQDEAFCAGLARAIGQERVIRALWPEKAASLEDLQDEIDSYAPFCGLLLADAGSSGGGHGRPIGAGGQGGAADWLACASFPRPWLLAGGLNPQNVGPLFSRFRPAGLDMNSGVESAPGIKDETLLRAAFSAIHALCAAKTNEVTP